MRGIKYRPRQWKIPLGKCPICLRENVRLFRDHDHRTGHQREPICGHCNSALGFLRDDPETAIRVAEYLITHGSQKETFGMRVKTRHVAGAIYARVVDEDGQTVWMCSHSNHTMSTAQQCGAHYLSRLFADERVHLIELSDWSAEAL